MPDQTVRVTFTPPDQWSFTPAVVTMTSAGKIQLHRDPGDAPWRFVGVDVAGGDRQFAVRINSNGGHATIDDRCERPGEYPYTVTVEFGGEQFRNDRETLPGDKAMLGDPPPVIQNEPT